MLKKFGRWLANRRRFIFSWYTKDAGETQEPERSLVDLPPEVERQLVGCVGDLPVCDADLEAILEAVEKAFERWQQDPTDTNNSVVILSSPVDAVSRILTESLKEWAEQRQIPLNLFPLTSRPQAISTIESKLEHYLVSKSVVRDKDSTESEIVVIPNLSWCFLRSLEGLGGIEYLQDLLCHGSRNRFWIIGGGQVGWQYLNSICSLEAYAGDAIALPKISAERLEEWLEPIVGDLELIFDEPRLDKKILDGDKDNRQNYFDRLADISKGVSTIAVQCFLESIVWEEADDGDESSGQPIAKTPQLPKLPDLNNAEQYLLYSLLLHEDMTLTALAESLADDEAEVRAIVQILRRKGVIEQQEKVYKINPIHYPKLKYELAINNFIVNRD